MCFHWCSACGMLQTGMGKEKRQKAFFSFFNSILPVRRFSGGVYSFISLLRLRPVRRRCLHCRCWCCCALAGLDPSDSLFLLLLPLSLAHSSPHSLPLLSLTLSHRFLWENSRSPLLPLLPFTSLWHWHFSLCSPYFFFPNLPFPSLIFKVLHSIIQLYSFCFPPFIWPLPFFSSWCSTSLLTEQLAVSVHVCVCMLMHVNIHTLCAQAC